MPNWCTNKATFRHKDPAQIRRLAEAFNAGALMTAFAPEPEGVEDGYGWRCENWGTKWDVGAGDNDEPVALPAESATEITISFLSAWAAPLAFYGKMEGLGFEVEAYYYEPGNCFCGIYEEGADDCFSIKGGSKWARKHLPTVLNEQMGIADEMAELEAEDEESAEEEESGEAAAPDSQSEAKGGCVTARLVTTSSGKQYLCIKP